MTEQKKRTGENFHVKEGRASEHTYSLCNRHGPMVVRRHLPARANLSRKFALASCFEHPKRTPNDFVRNYITPVRSSISLAVYGACSGHSHRTCFCFEKCDIGNGGENARRIYFGIKLLLLNCQTRPSSACLQRNTMEMQWSGIQKHSVLTAP